MDIQGYLTEIRALAASGQATEHSYRPALARLFKSIDADLTAIATDCVTESIVAQTTGL
jgi:hypothetical protein